ncbi:MAG: bifunctional aspartate kinase/homoserine dehydrogenase I, partial [Bacteroidia bacterium]
SQYNVSFVVKRRDETKALTVIHEEFFLSPTKKLHVYLVGVGLIGQMLLSLIKKHQAMLQERYGLVIKIVGLANSKKMLISTTEINVDNAQQQLEGSNEPVNMAAFIDRMKTLNLRNSIFVDCTASENIASTYFEVLSNNISIVTPNKRANSGRYQDYKDLQMLAKRKKIKFSYEANVGGGLPIISTINNLLSSGDKIVKIEAVLSGTLSYIFSTFMQGASFSTVVKEAQAKGYTEPDPRDDLNGMDVKRKLLILARECGHIIELDDLAIKPFLSEECFAAENVAAFYTLLESQNEHFAKLREDALKHEKVLRYIALFENGKGTISLQAVGREHPFYNLPASDNIIALFTERYYESPLVIQGKGAGAEVTAGKVLAGIIDCGRE